MSTPLSSLPPKMQTEAAKQLYVAKQARAGVSRPVAGPIQRRKTFDAPFLLFLAENGIPSPVQELRFDEARKWRFDYAWAGCRIALEVEGGVWTKGRHVYPTGFLRDMEKYNAASAAGWRILRCQPKDLRTAATVELIRKAIRQGDYPLTTRNP